MSTKVDLYSETRKHCHTAKMHLERAIAYCNCSSEMDKPLDWALDAAFNEILSANQSHLKSQKSNTERSLKYIQQTQHEIEQLIGSVNEKHVLVQMIKSCSKRLEEIS